MSARSIDRRSFVVGVLATGAALYLAAGRPWRTVVAYAPERSLAARLAGVLADERGARVVGRVYIDATPGEESVARLVDEIVASLPVDRTDLRDLPNGELRSALRARVRKDFQEGAVVTLDGWIVSRTEGRLCALALV